MGRFTGKRRNGGLITGMMALPEQGAFMRTAIAVIRAAVIAAMVLVAIQVSPAAAASKAERIEWRMELRSAGTTLQQLPNGLTYGWNDLRAGTKWAGQDATVRFLGDVQYVDGSGPFNGYVTVTRADGAVLGMRVEGSALSLASGDSTADARFSGNITVIGGDGAYRGARGIGTMSGARQAALGSPVTMTFRLTVVR